MNKLHMKNLHCIPEGCNLHIHCHDNLKSLIPADVTFMLAAGPGPSNLWPAEYFHPTCGINKDRVLVTCYMYFINTTYHKVNFQPLFLNLALHLNFPKPMWPTNKKGWRLLC
jgi:hypothetical protein